MHAVGGLVLGREEKHRHPPRAAGQAAVDLEAVQVGQHDVEHDQVGVEGRGPLDRRPAIVRRLHLEALVAQHRRDELGDRVLVVDHEDSGRGLCVFVCLHLLPR